MHKSISSFAAFSLVALLVSGCGSNEAPSQRVEEAASPDASDPDTAKAMADANLKALLKDPDSAKFRNVVVTKLPGGNLMLCGEVNSKNAFGGFTGYKPFIASPNPDAPTIIKGETAGITKQIFEEAQQGACGTVVARYS